LPLYKAKSGKLELDRAIVTREVFFYALSIVLLYAALQDKRPVPDDTVDHIYISFFDAALIFSGYLLYIVVLVNMEALMKLLRRSEPGLVERKDDYGSTNVPRSKVCISENTQSAGLLVYPLRSELKLWLVCLHTKRSSFHFPDMPFLTETTLANEPVGNFAEQAETVELSRSFTGRNVAYGNIETSIRSALGHYSDHASTRVFRFLMYNEKPSDQHNLHDLEIDAVRRHESLVGSTLDAC
jgi:hypothetical protein